MPLLSSCTHRYSCGYVYFE